jgi:hypothetical protein
MFDRLKYAPGPVGELLNDGARQIAEGAKPGVIADRIRGQVAEAVRSAMDEQDLPTARPAAAAAEPAEAAPRAVELTPEQRQAAQIEVIRRAVDEAEVRPPETPIPELPDGPALTPDLARADLETRGGQVEPGTPAAQAMADEIRLTAEFAERDAQMRAIAEEGAKDAMGYELKTFEEKKALGMTDGYDPEPVMPTEVMPRDTGPSIADMFEQQSRELAQSDARLYRRVGEGLQRMREGLDQLDQLEDPALAPAPVRPEPLQLADDPPPEPTALIRFTPTQRAELENMNETLLREMGWSLDGPMGKQQLEALERNIRTDYASPEAGGLDEVSPQVRRSMIGLADKMRKAIEGLDQQPQGGRPKPRSKKADQAARQQIQANEQRMAEIRRKAQQEGC